jgi:hypothetical protein
LFSAVLGLRSRGSLVQGLSHPQRSDLAQAAVHRCDIGVIAAVLIIAVFSEIADSVSQIAAVHPYLPTHWWLSFGVYAVIFLAIAWARFTSFDVTS